MIGIGCSLLQNSSIADLPDPPEGFAYVIDSEGRYVVDDEGNYVVAEI